MRYKVLQRFRDKFTGERYAIGTEYETSDWRRAKTLQEMGFLGDKVTQRKTKKRENE